MANSAPSSEASPCAAAPACASTLAIFTPPRSHVKLASVWASDPAWILMALNPVETSFARALTWFHTLPAISRSAQEANSALVP